MKSDVCENVMAIRLFSEFRYLLKEYVASARTKNMTMVTVGRRTANT